MGPEPRSNFPSTHSTDVRLLSLFSPSRLQLTRRTLMQTHSDPDVHEKAFAAVVRRGDAVAIEDCEEHDVFAAIEQQRLEAKAMPHHNPQAPLSVEREARGLIQATRGFCERMNESASREAQMVTRRLHLASIAPVTLKFLVTLFQKIRAATGEQLALEGQLAQPAADGTFHLRVLDTNKVKKGRIVCREGRRLQNEMRV